MHIKVGAFGKEGSYSHLAAQRAYPTIQPISISHTNEIFHELHEGRIDVAVVPLENTSGGWVEDVVFELIKLRDTDPDVRIINEIQLPIVLCAATNPSNTSRTVKRVYSHPYPLVYSREWLSKNYADAERVETSSTSDAAERAAKDHESIALCNRSAAKRVGLEVIIPKITPNDANRTRFVSLSKKIKSDVQGKVKSSLCLSTLDKPGALLSALEIFSQHQVNLTRILSRSTDCFKSYDFFIEVDGDLNSDALTAARNDLKSKTLTYSILGAYPLLHTTEEEMEKINSF